MTPEAFVVCPIVGLLTLLLALRSAPEHRSLVLGAFGAHVLATFGIVAYHEYVYGGGDMFLYATQGRDLMRLLRTDAWRWGPEVVKLALHREHFIPVPVTLPGTPTGTMIALTGLLMYVVGPTIHGVSLLLSFFSFYGSVRLYHALGSGLPNAERRAAIASILFVPSVLFWTSGIVKEAFVFAFFGVLSGAMADLLVRRRIRALPLLVIAGLGVSLIKPYVLFAVLLSAGGWLYAGRGRTLSIQYKLLGLVVAVGGVFVISTIFPEFAPDKLGATVALEQRKYLAAIGGGSNIEIGDLDANPADQSLFAQLRFFPLALVNALFRPTLLDIHNGATFMAAIEMTVVLVVIVQLVRRQGLRGFVSAISSRPQYVAAVWFVVPFAVSVGLATRNLGTLSRYRVPAMPLMFFLLFALRAATQKRPVPLPRAKVRGAARTPAIPAHVRARRRLT